MQKLSYHVVDVFTETPFGGNQLAVFTSGQHVPEHAMQKLAREINFSETTFVMPPQDSANDFGVRIFTPAMELPTAGHPTIGTAFVLAREGFIDLAEDRVTVRLEEGVGVIPVTLTFDQGAPDLITMQQPLPTFGAEIANRAAIAEMLSITPADLLEGYPIQVVSSGVPFTFVPLKNLEVIQRAKLRGDLWEKTLKDTAAPKIFMFTLETENSQSTVHSRMFAPSLGIAEDAATGIASGPLGCYLVKYGLVSREKWGSMISEQGIEMGRPSLIHISIDYDGANFTGVRVGGRCVAVAEGYFYEDLFD